MTSAAISTAPMPRPIPALRTKYFRTQMLAVHGDNMGRVDRIVLATLTQQPPVGGTGPSSLRSTSLSIARFANTTVQVRVTSDLLKGPAAP